ncbi:MAG: exonuclease domain-containing protein [Paludibacter sp.]|nr:exonuclease domain-containing protein [Paludibacter sp.]
MSESNFYDFVAIDFENADNSQFACQVGIVVVRNRKIVEEIEYLIQPPGNKYGKIQMQIHGITPEKTKNLPEFDEIWVKIKPYIENQTLLMHNASADLSILLKTLFHYFIPEPKFKCIDTCEQIGKYKLDVLAKAFDVKLLKHHNALDDARATTEIWLKHCDGYKHADFDVIKSDSHKNNYDLKRVDSDLFVKDLTLCSNINNPFYDRSVVITGDFSIPRNQIAKLLKSMGADVNSSISKRTNFVLIGNNPGTVKMDTISKLKHNGYNINLIYEDDFNDIISGNNTSDYHTEKEIKKNLKISLTHIYDSDNKFMIDLNKINLFANKEFYVGENLKGNRNYIYQLIGYLGAMTNEDIDQNTNIILLSDNTIYNIKNECFDETVEYIQNLYNSNKSVNLTFKFISEEDFMEYYRNRVEGLFFDDFTVKNTYNRYLESII